MKEKPFGFGSQGTPEEIKEAEKMLDRKEVKMSRMREKDVESVKSLEYESQDYDLLDNLKAGKYKLKIDESHGELTLEGKIKNRKIYLHVGRAGHGFAKEISGSIGDKNIEDINRGEEIAWEIIDKYREIANLQNDNIYSDRADTEIYKEDEAAERNNRENIKKRELEEKKKQKEELEEKRQLEKARKKFKDIL